jgi:hypothetical protein
LRRRLVFLSGEREQARNGAQRLYLCPSLGMRREVLFELPMLFLGKGVEDVGVLELFEAPVVHPVHLGTAMSCEPK